MTNEEIVAMTIKKAGGIAALARSLGIRLQSIQNWKKIPAERVLDIEAAIGLPREKLRPDLYRKSKIMAGG